MSAPTTPDGPVAVVAQPHIEDLAVGQELPAAIRNASRVQLFLYSAATWNPHRIHYDVDYARFEGHSDIIVHGPLQGAWLSQYVTDWAGPAGRLLNLSWRNRASALPETDYRFRGRVTAIDGDTVSLDVWEETLDGAVLMPGQAVVRLPQRPG
jgi:hydroxyacyl-ACP dehydratase HTD2-like protein with hotdog domain